MLNKVLLGSIISKLISFVFLQVLIALQEKEVEYEAHNVNIVEGQQNEAWYMRINPSGTVPTLTDGEKVIRESEDIIDYIDREFPRGMSE